LGREEEEGKTSRSITLRGRGGRSGIQGKTNVKSVRKECSRKEGLGIEKWEEKTRYTSHPSKTLGYSFHRWKKGGGGHCSVSQGDCLTKG